ncbi:MAG: DNA methylase, partial [Firmicutes bacterium]|nr:DNA methylase [Bacillota bacterium]
EKQMIVEVGEELAKVVVTYLAFAIDRYAEYNSKQCVWQLSSEAITPTFGRQALPMMWDYIELNPLNESLGSFDGNIKRISEIVEHVAENCDSEIHCLQGDATRLPLDNNSIDIVVTDPPYYDAVPYSELSDFFYIWLKRSIGHLYPDLFRTPLSPKSAEIVQHRNRHGTQEESKNFFETGMTNAFTESNRILTENGILVVVFAHKSTDAWETLINGLLKAKFIVTSSWPIKSETQSRLRSQGSAALASSIFIVCRKRKSEEEGYFNEVKEELIKKIKTKLDQFWSQGIRGADFFISAIGPAVEVFGKYKKVLKLSGEEVSVAELLDLVREIVTDYSLHKILKGRHMGKVDEETRFYLLWRWAYGDSDVPYDDARKLAQALGTEADDLLNRKDLLEKKSEKVNMLEPWQRIKNSHLGEQKGGILAPMIDVIHKACLLWEKNDKQELTEFLENCGYQEDDTIWNVAQAISEVLPDGNKEKQLIQGFLVSKHSISKDIGKKENQNKLQDFVK